MTRTCTPSTPRYRSGRFLAGPWPWRQEAGRRRASARSHPHTQAGRPTKEKTGAAIRRGGLCLVSPVARTVSTDDSQTLGRMGRRGSGPAQSSLDPTGINEAARVGRGPDTSSSRAGPRLLHIVLEPAHAWQSLILESPGGGWFHVEPQDRSENSPVPAPIPSTLLSSVTRAALLQRVEP